MRERIYIEKSALEKLKEHVAGAYPYEGCGILLSEETDGKVTDIRITDNKVREEGYRGYFRIDPLELYDMEKQAEKNGQKIAGFFHSHPNCEPALSDEDEKYMIPGTVYLIASVRRGVCMKIEGYIKEGPDEGIRNPDIRTDEEV